MAPDRSESAKRQRPLRPLSAARRELIAGRLRDEGLRSDHLATIPRRRGTGPAALSYAQQRLWVLDQLAAGSSFYNVMVALRLSGRLEVAALAGALAAVVRRHESLRTTFPAEGGRPLQVIAAGGAARRPRQVDLEGLPAGRARAEARRLAEAEARRPFDLARGPLVRGALLRLGAAEHVFLLTLHHVVFDGWSSGVLVHELTTLYAAGVAGRPAPLARLPIQYADYAEWQRQWLEDGRLAGQLDYWRQQLAGSPPALELPADHPRPPVESHRGRFHRVHVPARAVDGLRALAREERATLFMALLAVFGTLLHRYTGQPDLLIGTPVANRRRPEIEGLIGFFVNTLVLRLDVGAAPPFRALLGQARATAQAAYAHQDLPFERLVEELQPGRELRRSPLFQVMLILQNAPRADLAVAGLGIARMEVEPGVAKFDLLLDLAEMDGGLAGGIEFPTDLFEAATIERLAGHLTALLAAAAATPEASVGELPMLGAAERAQLLWEWSDTPGGAPPAGRGHGGDLLEPFRQQVRLRPRAPALTMPCGGRRDSWTYRDLAIRAGLLARRLRRLGVGPEVRVGVLAERAPERTAALLAVLAAGGVYVPLDPLHPRRRLLFIVADADVSMLVGRRAALEALDWRQGPEVDWETWREEEVSAAPQAAAPGDEAVAAEALPEALAYVIYTSGSTGAPKGVALPRRTLASLLRWHPAELPGAARTLQFAAPGFDVSLQEDLSTLCSGGELVVVPDEVRLDPERLLRLLDEEGVERVFLPVVALQALAAAARRVPAAGTLRDVIAAGETLRITPPVAEWLARMPACRLHNHYGPSESHVVTALRLAGPSGGWPLLPAIGRPVPGARIEVLDGRLAPVPIGVVGELAIGGPPLARGYLGQPRLTAERFVPDPHAGPADARRADVGERLYRTGDLARWRPDGSLELLGRSDRQVKVRGMRVEPAEIEAALEQQPGVSQAVVEARQDASGNRRLVAYLAGEPDTELDAAEIARALRARLPEPMVPALLLLPGRLPLTASGKIDRRALPALAAVGAAGVGGAAGAPGGELLPPRDAVEEMLAAIWCSLLDLPAVSVDDDFFALGGHSLLATQLVSRIRDACGSELPLQRVFEAPVLAAMAEAVRGSGGVGAAPPLAPLAEPGDRVLSFAQQRLWFLDRLVPANPFYNMFQAFDLAGAVSLPALAAALREIVRRHQALRTVFREEQGVPLQVVLPPGLQVPGIDLEALPGAAAEAEVARLVRQEAARPFDLARGPVVRAQSVRLAAERHVLLLNVHHIACDGWSIGVFERELVALYRAFVQGAPSPLPELPIQYGDFAVWQRGWLQGEALSYRLSYWLRHLAGAPADLELPRDRPRPAVERFRGSGARLTLSAALTAGLKALARDQGATLYMVLLAGWKALLARYCGQTRIVVGSAVANRRRSETEALIGFFVNVLAMHTDLAGDPGFGEVVARVREVALGAFAHQDLPFEMLVDKLQVERDLGRNPLCQVMFTWQNFPRRSAELPGLAMTARNAAAPDSGTAKFDLVLFGAEAGDGIDFYLEYSTDLFDAATMARMLAHLEGLLQAGVAAPGRRLAELPLLTPAERHQLLIEWNDAPRGLRQPRAGSRPAFSNDAR